MRFTLVSPGGAAAITEALREPALREALLALPRHGHAVCLNAVGERVMRLAKAADVKLTMNSLRKGFGCRYAGKVLQRLMRHSNITLTMNYYANVDDAVMRAVLGDGHNASRNNQPPSREDIRGSTPQTPGQQGA